MEAIDLKNRIQFFLEHADERVLNIVNSVFENYYENDPVAYHPDGSPMSRKEYKQRLDTGVKQAEEGNSISVEELKKEMSDKFDMLNRK